MRLLAPFLLLTLPLAARADDRKVFFFGGAHSQHGEMAACYPGLETIASGEAYGKYRAVAQEINANPDKKYVVAGHSDGSAWIFKVVELLKNPDQIRLINIDGLDPEGKDKRVKDSVCWTSTNGRGMKGKNLPNMSRCRQMKTFTAPQCETQWCLHFALVNRNTPGDISGNDWAKRGMNNCAGNKEWLNP